MHISGTAEKGTTIYRNLENVWEHAFELPAEIPNDFAFFGTL